MNSGVAELRHKRAQLLNRLHSEQRQTAVLAEQLAWVKERLAATWSSNQQLLLENSQLRQAVEDASETAAGTSSSDGNTPSQQFHPVADPSPSWDGQPPIPSHRDADGIHEGASTMPLLARHHSAPWELMASPSMLHGHHAGTMAPPAAVVRPGLMGCQTGSPMTRSGSCSLLSSNCGTLAAPGGHALPPGWPGGSALPGMPPLQRYGSGASCATLDALPPPPAWLQQQHQLEQQQQSHAEPLQGHHSGELQLYARRMQSNSSPPEDLRAPGPHMAAMPPVWAPPPGMVPPGAGGFHGRGFGCGGGSSSSSSSRPPMPLRPALSLPPAWDGAPSAASYKSVRPLGPLGGFVGPPFPRPPLALGGGAHARPPFSGCPQSPSAPLPPPMAGRALCRSNSSPYLSHPVSPTWGNSGPALYRSNSSGNGFLAAPGQDARSMQQHPPWLPAAGGHVKGDPVGGPALPPFGSSSSGIRPVLGPAGAAWPMQGPYGIKQEPAAGPWMAAATAEEGGCVTGPHDLLTHPSTLHNLHESGLPTPALRPAMPLPYGPGASSGSGEVLVLHPKEEVPSPVLSVTVAMGDQAGGRGTAWGSAWSPGSTLGPLDGLAPMGDGDDATMAAAAHPGAAAAATAGVGRAAGTVCDHLDLTVDQVEALLEDGAAWPGSSSNTLIGSPAVATSGTTPSFRKQPAQLHSTSGAAVDTGVAVFRPLAAVRLGGQYQAHHQQAQQQDVCEQGTASGGLPQSQAPALLHPGAFLASAAGAEVPAGAALEGPSTFRGRFLTHGQVGSNSSSSSSNAPAALLGAQTPGTAATEQQQVGGPLSSAPLGQQPAAGAGFGLYHSTGCGEEVVCAPRGHRESPAGVDMMVDHTRQPLVPGSAAYEPPASDSSNMTEVLLGAPLPLTAPSDVFKF